MEEITETSGLDRSRHHYKPLMIENTANGSSADLNLYGKSSGGVPARGRVVMTPTTLQMGTITDNNVALRRNNADVASLTANGLEVAADKYLRVGFISSLPAASAAYRGMLAFVEGGSGVADALYVCRKSSTDAYNWVGLF